MSNLKKYKERRILTKIKNTDISDLNLDLSDKIYLTSRFVDNLDQEHIDKYNNLSSKTNGIIVLSSMVSFATAYLFSLIFYKRKYIVGNLTFISCLAFNTYPHLSECYSFVRTTSKEIVKLVKEDKIEIKY